ncbi:MAG: hypothetical protein KGI71_04155 [Patescibacteria group bacterium]|nr:hypothetical protein [Patescibacteria group bacterium]
MSAPSRIAKSDLFALAEVAHAEGIGPRRLAKLVGYSREQMRRIYRMAGLAPLAAHSNRAPSVRLIGLLECVPQSTLARIKAELYAAGGTVRPKNTEPA